MRRAAAIACCGIAPVLRDELSITGGKDRASEPQRGHSCAGGNVRNLADVTTADRDRNCSIAAARISAFNCNL